MIVCLGVAFVGKVFAETPSIAEDFAFAPEGFADREVEVVVPERYDPEESLPLLVALHGANLEPVNYMETNYKLRPLMNRPGQEFITAYPVGTAQAWNAEIYGWNHNDNLSTIPDDTTFLRRLIEGIQSRVRIDRERIWILGHSNGGGMAYRMACEHGDLVAGIVVIGSFDAFSQANRCRPSEPVHVLHLQGTEDNFVEAKQSVETWAAYNGHTEAVVSEELVMKIGAGRAGLDTSITRWMDGSVDGLVEFWTVHKGGHSLNGRHEPSGSSAVGFYAMEWLIQNARNRPPALPALTIRRDALVVSFPVGDGAWQLESRAGLLSAWQPEEMPGIEIDGVRYVAFTPEEMKYRYRLSGANPPELRLEHGGLLLSYSAAAYYGDWGLESHPSMNEAVSGAWQVVDTVIVGTEKRVFSPRQSMREFYRLGRLEAGISVDN